MPELETRRAEREGRSRRHPAGQAAGNPWLLLPRCFSEGQAFSRHLSRVDVPRPLSISRPARAGTQKEELDMKRRFTLGLALLAGALVAALVSPFSRAELPGKNGRIAYMVKDQAGYWQVWVANSDLSGAKELTRGHYDSGWAVWSPDGKRVAFDSNRTDRTPNNSRHVNDIFVMRSDGSGVKKLTDSKGASGDAAWSPSGSLIAFDADRGNRMGFGAIYVKRSDGRKLRRVTDPRPPLTDYSPRFSPDGTHLVFLRAKGTGDNAPGAIFT